MIALEDQPFSPAFRSRWKTHTCFITNTHIWLRTPPSQSKRISNIPAAFAVMSFRWFFSSLPFLPFHLFHMPGKWKQRLGTRWLNCSSFAASSHVNTEPVSVNWNLQLVVTEQLGTETWDSVGIPHNPALVPVSFSCHSNPNTPRRSSA